MDDNAEAKELSAENKIQCEFDWQKEPREWAGLNESELRKYIDELADTFGISPEDRSKIHIHFGDHKPFTYLDGHQETHVARMIPTENEYSDKSSEVVSTDIVLNRSKELVYNLYEINEEKESKSVPEEYEYKIEDEQIVATLRNPWEGALWLLAEELNHAAVYLRLKDGEKLQKAEINYRAYVQAFFDTDRNDENYTYDFLEVTAARQVLIFLEKVARERNPERAAFFRQMRQLSLEKRMTVIPRTALILDELYIKTGFKSISGK